MIFVQYRVEEIGSVDARIRVDIYGKGSVQETLGDTAWLGYRLGNAYFCNKIEKEKPDMIWFADSPNKRIEYIREKDLVVLYGEWAPGELQRLVLCLLVRNLERNNHYVFHSSAVHYKGKNILFMSGETNHGKTMSLIEAAWRGAEIISTEGTIVDVSGKVLAGTKEVFLRRRPRGTERSDIPSAREGWRKFFKSLPEFKIYEKPVDNIDLVVLPDIDGHYDTFVKELPVFEREYQTFCCICATYYQYYIVLSPGIPMPVLDDDDLRAKRAHFVSDFARGRPFYLIRGKTPAIILDEIEKIL